MFILVVGLPGSGKSTYVKNNYPDFLVHDDFLSKVWDGKCISDVNKGKDVILIDPRLTYPKTFLRTITMFNRDPDLIILFENNPDQCIMNSRLRVPYRDVEKNIICFSEHYSMDTYSNYKTKLLPVYK